MIKKIGKVAVELVEGDITAQDTDAVVNAANEHLILGGGVAGAIRSRGGPSIQAECDRIGHTPVGSAAITGAGSLPAEYVIHAVGPRMGEGSEFEKLRSCVRRSLELAEEKGLRSISFPAISTGIFGVPPSVAAPAMVWGIVDHIKGGTDLDLIRIVLFGSKMMPEFSAEIEKI
ncbi:MAG: macro domain-containing protein [Thermoplasmatota archaeon]